MTEHAVTTVDSGPHQVTRQALIHAPADQIFALLVDPHRHPELDGSGTVRDVPVTGPERLSQDATFTVGMKVLGIPYKITSRVTAFEENKLLEWQHPMGHHWRWELAETEPGTTRVTETFDYTEARSPKFLERFGYPAKNGKGITKTLQALIARFG